MRFLGSAMRTPLVQGGFANFIVCDAANASPWLPGVDAAMAAFAEPLAVCMHAVGQAPVYGARVLIVGAGPIGLLLLLSARLAHARSGGHRHPRQADRLRPFAQRDHTVNVAVGPDALAGYEANKGYSTSSSRSPASR